MPRLILKCPYLKAGSAAAHKEHYTRYIATRDGAEPIEPEPDLTAKRENYVDYIAKRPRAERMGTHGLFTQNGPVVLSEVAQTIAQHSGNVWLPIISLRREDAERLGYDSGKDWRELLRAQTDLFARSLKIRRENFRWYASFHNEAHHPHVHMICYSTNPNEGYLTERGIEQLKSGLAKQIFRQDLLEIYAEQTERRDELVTDSTETMHRLCQRIESVRLENPVLVQMLLQLKKRLDNTGGKKVYGYLKPEVKRLVDEIVDELAKEEHLAELYALWYEKRFDVLRTYTDRLPDMLPLSQQKELKQIRNMVIWEVLQLSQNSAQELLSTAVTRLAKNLARLLEEDYQKRFTTHPHTDRKLLQTLAHKKEAMGIKIS
ncbi:MAG: hypothetical protein HFG20_11710 [Anaerotruncus sp.]|nr:hypothetical protein [Anaerotruncus sp.]